MTHLLRSCRLLLLVLLLRSRQRLLMLQAVEAAWASGRQQGRRWQQGPSAASWEDKAPLPLLWRWRIMLCRAMACCGFYSCCMPRAFGVREGLSHLDRALDSA